MKTALDLLDEEIASLSAQLNVVTHALLSKIRAFDLAEGWAAQGYQSCAHYLGFRIGLAPGAAREHVRVAHAIAALPQIDAALASGALSYSKARALSRIAKPDNEGDLLAMANDISAAALEKIVKAYRRVETADAAAKREALRGVSYHVDDDGMFVLQARLLAEEGALVMKAIEAAPARAGKHLVDAFVQMAERSLASASNGERTAADLHQVVVHVDAEVLAARQADGRAEIDGHGVSAETAQRLCCDASVLTMTHDKDGNVVDTGRKTRTIRTPLRRKLKERDQNACRFPGCTHRFTDAHHIEHWAKGGPTTLSNLVSLCKLHHRFVHEQGFSVQRTGDGAMVFADARGRPIATKPAALAGDAAMSLSLPTAVALPPTPNVAGRQLDYGYVMSALLGQSAQRGSDSSALAR